MKKTSLKKRVIESDNAKKVNPLDLSSDQDLSIGVMNMLAIEELCPNTDLAKLVYDIRTELISKIVSKSSDLWEPSLSLLAKSMRLMNTGTELMAAGDKLGAYDSFENAYHFYSLFWGVNMGLIGVTDIKDDI